MEDRAIRVLLVDPDEAEFVLTRGWLREGRHGPGRFHVEWADNYDDARAEIGRARHDAYLINYRLGQQNGLELLTSAVAGGCRAPVILLAGQCDDRLDEAAMQAGAADCLEKGQLNGPLLQRAIRHAVERRRTDRQLLEAERRFRNMLDAVRLVAVGLDTDGNLNYANPHLLELAGYSRDDVMGHNWFDTFVPEGDRAAVRAVHGHILDGDSPVHYENPILTRTGEERLIAWNNTTLFDEAGQCMGTMSIGEDITERRSAQQALKERERYYRSLLYGLHEDVLVIDRAYRITDVNDSVLRMTGHRRDEVIGRHCFDLLHGLEGQCDQYGEVCELRRVFETGEPASCIHEHLRADGSKVSVDVMLSPLRDEQGKVTHVIEALRDITDLIEAQQSRTESEELLRQVIDATSVGIFVKDREGNYVVANELVAEIHGTTADKLVGTNERDYSVFEPAAVEAILEDDRSVIDSKRSRTATEQDITGLDGATRWFHTVKVPLTIQGRPDYVLGVAVDVTERRSAEKALKESEELLAQVIDATPAAIFVKDRTGNFVMVNSQVAEMYGVSADQMVGTNERDYSVYSSEQIDSFLETDRQVISGRQPVVVSESPAFGPDGEDRWFHTVKVPLTVGANPDCVLAVAVDVSERVLAERALWEAEVQLQHQERLAAIGQLAGGVAHDFNNYLTVIMLGAQVALRKPYLPPDLQRTFETSLETSRRAATLVQQLLDFSRRSLVDIRPLDFGPWLQDFCDVLRRTLPESIGVTMRVKADHCVASVDQGRIQQALMNLATNARDAMPDGGELRLELTRLEVDSHEEPPVAGLSPGEWVGLTISDTGAGMSEEVQSHLFEPFFTTKEMGKGTGLGLAQVYGIVMQHSGHVVVESELDRGTVIHIYFPAYAEETLTAAEEHVPPPRGRGETILLVEDEDDLRDVGQEILEDLGYEVLTASHGREALEVIGSGRTVDLVITDMVMPQMGGKELMRELRRRDPDQKGLIITGYALSEDLRELRNEGFIDTVPKPFDVETLARVIRTALDHE